VTARDRRPKRNADAQPQTETNLLTIALHDAFPDDDTTDDCTAITSPHGRERWLRPHGSLDRYRTGTTAASTAP
jgi:hypothetical protein